MKRLLTAFAVSIALTAGAFAADLTIDARFDLTGKDVAGSYLTFKAPTASVDKAKVDPAKADAISAASTQTATKVWNSLQPDATGKSTFPAGFQSLLKYPVSPIAQYNVDLPKAWKNADGSITFQYLHRGTAYKFSTDKTGKFVFPLTGAVLRKVGLPPPAGQIAPVLSADISKDGTTAGIDWAKVWDAAVTGDKISPIADDKPASTTTQWVGSVQVTLTGSVVTLKGDLTAQPIK